MKLLLDQNLSRRLLPELAALFPGSSHVQLEGLESASDTVVWQFASENGFSVVTKDVDFLELQLIRGFPPKLVWLNCGNVPNTEVAHKLMTHAETIRMMLNLSDIGVVTVE